MRPNNRCCQIGAWWLAVFTSFFNVFCIYIILTSMGDDLSSHPKAAKRGKFIKSRLATFIWREFEHFDNDIISSVNSIISMHSNVSVLVISDEMPYPPLKLPQSPRVKGVSMQSQLGRPFNETQPDTYIDSDYVVFMPDATQPMSDKTLPHIMEKLTQISDDVKMIAWPADSQSTVTCLGLNVKTKHWTLQYYKDQAKCTAVDGNFVLAMKTEHLMQLPRPFQRPLTVALFIQTAVMKWKVLLDASHIFKSTKSLFSSEHLQQKHEQKEQSRLLDLYHVFGVKLVQSATGEELWYGCSKKSSRCFGNIIDDMPDYLYQGRWTPPCCLKALRETGHYVFSILEAAGVRYWLEGGSLLGAARHSDIIPWDYDIDIGIYEDDIAKCSQLKKAQEADFVDEFGFLWQRAFEGGFIRVQYSATNHLHVDIFPFRSREGVMTKDTWLKSHRQDMEFPEHFLKPLVKITFAGGEAYAPNNWQNFLELKFGKGVIENPKYPDLSNV